MSASSNNQKLIWKRSRFCADSACVEVAVGRDGAVLMRDGKRPDGPVLSFPAASWKAFLCGVTDEHFTHW